MRVKYGNPHLFMVTGFFASTALLPGDSQEENVRKVSLVLAILILLPGFAQAEVTTLDPVVVTATRTATPLSQIGSSVTVVTAEEIEEKQLSQILDVLRTVPGVGIVHSGPQGGQTSVRTRGTDNKHTLVLIDGIEIRDVSTVGGGPDLANISTDNVERIEIVRGAQSVIYGSDAIGGVINIITKKQSSVPEGYFSVEGGSYNSWKEKAGFSLPGASFTVSRTDSDGFSSYNEKDGFSEDDGYKSTNASLNIGGQLNETMSLKFNLRLADSSYDFDSGYYDSSFNYVQADTDAVVDTLQVAGRGEATFSLLDGNWILTLGSSLSDTNRTTSGTYDNYEYDGSIEKFDLQNTVLIGTAQVVVIGLETEKENYTSSYGDSGKVRNTALYIQDQVKFGNFSTAIGGRVDDHETFGSEFTWRVAPTYLISSTHTRLKTSVGTGFKAPSLFQLYYPYGGNEELEPETSLSFDIGFEQSLADNKIVISSSWFYNDIEDYIDWYSDGDFDYYDGDGYHNIKSLKTQGIETTVAFYPISMVNLQLGYTYTDTEDQDGARKARIPLHKGTFDVNIYPIAALQLNANLIYVGEREDGAADEILGDYTLVNLATSYQLTDNFKIFARVDNLFDKDYEEVAGYGTAGLSGYAGVKFSF